MGGGFLIAKFSSRWTEMLVAENESYGAFHFAKSNGQKPVELSIRENGTTLFSGNKVSNQIEAIHLRLDRNFD